MCIRDRGKGYSSRALTRLKKDPLGLLRNGAHVRTVDLLAEGDRLEVTLREEANTYARCDTPVPILWEDEDFVAFDKPAGIPCHTSWAVSYTHLDVYKRQGLSRPAGD